MILMPDHFKSSFPIWLKEENWFGNAADCCLYLTPLKVNGPLAEHAEIAERKMEW